MLDRELEQEYKDACKLFCYVAADPSATKEEWDAAWQLTHDLKCRLTGCAPRKATKNAYKQRFANYVVLRGEED